MPFQREAQAKKIAARLNVLASQLKTLSRASFTDANHTLEFVMARFFNALFGWKLVNLNAGQANFPAADLGDRDRRIAMQITNEDASRKIATTTATAVEHRLGGQFDRLILFFLLSKKPGVPKGFAQPADGPEIECWDLKDLLGKMMQVADVSALASAWKVLEEERSAAEPQPGRIALHTLPPRPEGFVGREDDLAKLRALNPAAGAVLTGLRGMGGIGKTALALVLAHEWAGRFPEAQLFLDARGTQADPPSAGDLLAQVIQTFHPTDPTAKLPEDLAALKGIYHDVLRGKKVLILLDNARNAAQAEPLIPPAGCGLIVTSRQTFMLGTTAPYAVDRLPDDEAVKLLRKYHNALSDAEAAALVKLCAGLPLALRLAGAHLAMDATERGGTPNVAAYLQALGGGRLKTLDADAPDAGVVTISDTLRLSEAMLPEAEREAWRKLGVFTASFDARAAAVIAGAEDATLGHFVRRSLLEREGADRYKLHDLVADYARSRLAADALAALHTAHARRYRDVGDEAQQLYLKGGGNVMRGLALFDSERAHLDAAFAWLEARGDEASSALLLSLVDAMPLICGLRFHPREHIRWLEAQRAAARRTGDRKQEGYALGNLGIAHVNLGGARKAVEFFEQQLVIVREIGDRRGEGNALASLGIAHANLGDARKAIKFYEHALVIDREIGDRIQEGAALDNLGLSHADLGETHKAIECYLQSLAIKRGIGDRRGVGIALGNLGLAHAALGDMRKAIEFYERALVIDREIGDRRGEGAALGNLGLAHGALGDARKAIEYAEQVLAIMREIDDRRGQGNALGSLGCAHHILGEARKAIEFYNQQLGVAREIGDRHGEGIALWNSALALDSLGGRGEAIARATAALAIYDAIEDPRAAPVRAALAKWRGAAKQRRHS